MPQDDDDENDLSEDNKTETEKEITIDISDLSAQYINKFHEDLDNCDSINEYYSLLTAILVFKNLVVSQFRRELEYSDDQNPDEVIKHLEDMANNISKMVVVGFHKNSMN
jgi:hypothetical protein